MLPKYLNLTFKFYHNWRKQKISSLKDDVNIKVETKTKYDHIGPIPLGIKQACVRPPFHLNADYL